MEITAYVYDGDLMTYDTAERIRRATSAERADSLSEVSGTGAISVEVSERTLRARCPHWVREYSPEARAEW